MSFSQRLSLSRKKRFLSQRELAKITGLKPSAISHFESGRRMPNFNNLCRLADGLNVNVDFLASRTDDFVYCGTALNFSAISRLPLEQQEFLAQMAEKLGAKNNELDG